MGRGLYKIVHTCVYVSVCKGFRESIIQDMTLSWAIKGL